MKFCIDCGKRISEVSIRCKSCENKTRHHSEETKAKLSKSKKGKLNPQFGKIYKRRIYREGYIYVFKPDHPFVSKSGYIAEHRLKIEEKLGRYLTKEERVHHLNNIKDDNRTENLKLLANLGEHNKIHNSWRIRDNHGKFTANLKPSNLK